MPGDLPAPVLADPVNIQRDVATVSVPAESGLVEIGRIQDNVNIVSGDRALTSRACPPFCIQPMAPAPGVTTIGEPELLAMLVDPKAMVIDSRVQQHFVTLSPGR